MEVTGDTGLSIMIMIVQTECPELVKHVLRKTDCTKIFTHGDHLKNYPFYPYSPYDIYGQIFKKKSEQNEIYKVYQEEANKHSENNHYQLMMELEKEEDKQQQIKDKKREKRLRQKQNKQKRKNQFELESVAESNFQPQNCDLDMAEQFELMNIDEESSEIDQEKQSSVEEEKKEECVFEPQD